MQSKNKSRNKVRLSPKPNAPTRTLRDEERYYGRRLCQTIFERRPESIRKVYVDEKQSHEFKELMRWCALNKIGYDLLTAERLEKISKSKHHEGLCIACDPIRFLDFSDFESIIRHRERTSNLVLALDDVGNPHNLGSILRTAAFFGITEILVPGLESNHLSASAARISEGGCEWTKVIRCRNFEGSLRKMKEFGFCLVGTSAHAKTQVQPLKKNDKTVLILGSENQGISRSVAKLCQKEIAIQGSGKIQSLNVGAACAVLLYGLTSQSLT